MIFESKRKIFLILDRHPVHRSAALQDWLRQHEATIRVFFLTAYSPELNPVDTVSLSPG